MHWAIFSVFDEGHHTDIFGAFCGQLAPTSHACKLISTYACQAMKKVSGEPLGLEPGTPASEIGSLPIDFQYPPYIWL